MPTDSTETLYQRYTREAEIDRQIQLRQPLPDSIRSDPIQPDPPPPDVHACLAESGASLRDIQVWLGHTNPATTTRYTHIERARLEAVKALVSAKRREKVK